MAAPKNKNKRKGKGRAKAKGKAKDKKRASKPSGPSLAKQADPHHLYQLAVQDAEHDVEYLRDVYKRVRRRLPRRLREDFCGTAIVCAEWVKQGRDYTAEGFDLHGPTLEWGRQHNLAPIGEAARRVLLHEKDVRSEGLHRADLTCAHNFSYQVFHHRSEMVEYFESVHRNLADDGVFVLDMFGGWEATEDLEEERWLEGKVAKYVWEQVKYSPVTGRQDCAIHFRFKDGSELHNAYLYEWRHWTMPELREILAEVGFPRVDAWFELLDEEGDGTGEFEASEEGINCESWLGYLVAYK